MYESIEDQAILHLLHIADEEFPVFPLVKVSQQPPSGNIPQANTTMTLRSRSQKAKTEAATPSERSANSTINKQCLKKMLEKLRDSPDLKRKIQVTRQSHPLRVLNSTKSQQKQTKNKTEAGGIMISKQREKQLLKSVIKSRLVDRLRGVQPRNSQKQTKFAPRRQLQASKKGLFGLRAMLRQQHSINLGALLSGKSSRVNIRQLLF